MEILHIENLTFSYPFTNKNALDGVNLSVNSGEFIVICGESGCGKTTLLKMMKPDLTPYGEITGSVMYNGEDIFTADRKITSSEIGFVLQNPESQIVTDKVWKELAFGLENIGVPRNKIRLRVGEMASYFGIGEWYHKKTDELSGGEKQLLNLASVMAMSPKILILDEPTSQLDPIAASGFIQTLKKLNRDLLLTVILVEHRLEDAFQYADRIVVMEKGKILTDGKPENVCEDLKNHKLNCCLPVSARIKNHFDFSCEMPVSVREGREFITENFDNKINQLDKKITEKGKEILSCKDVFFRYSKNGADILKGVNFSVYGNETYMILGANGAGKTTLLNVISGIGKAYRGKIKIFDRKIGEYKNNSLYKNCLCSVPQNPQNVFLKETVYEDFYDICKINSYDENKTKEMIDEVMNLLDISHLSAFHPYDLSGGEQQKCAIAKALLTEPKILLLDEPTKGMDGYSKKNFASILSLLKKRNITVIIVTHDIEFAAENGERCALFFDGEIISEDEPKEFFSENDFYTTAASRISREFFDKAVTCDDVIKLCEINGRGHKS